MKKILLIGNYEPDRQHSMLRYTDWLADLLAANGYQVVVERPAVRFGRLAGSNAGLVKWLGYLDKLVIFPWRLVRITYGRDLVHICDHSNAVYNRFIRGRAVVAVTCHDLLAVRAALGEFKGQCVKFSGRLLQACVLSSLRRIRFVCCVSMATQQDFVRLAGDTHQRIVLIPNPVIGFSPMAAPDVSSALRGLGDSVASPFLLHVGASAWYKNRDGVLALYARLRGKPRFVGFHLVFAGEELTPSMREFILQQDIGARVHVIRTPSPAILRALYCAAAALLFPSLQEGFGWPIVEAQACGCPVITSDREPMRSIGGGAALLIDPEKLDDAAEKIDRCWDEFRDRGASIANAARFSERNSADGYLAFYKSILGS